MNRLPGEFEKQVATVVLFPARKDVWRDDCKPIRSFMVNLANIIAEYQPVIFGVLPELMDYVKANYTFHENVQLKSLEYNDCWARDTVSSVIISEAKKYFTSFQFNAYGGELYKPWDADNRLDEAFASQFNYGLQESPLTLEGGNIMPDGNGTVFCVEDAVVNKNRNPDFTKAQIEEMLKEATCSKQVVWIPKGLIDDETGGHIDNVLAFADSETILYSWTDDKNNAHYDIVREIEAVLKNARNVDGKPYKLIRLPVPDLYQRTSADANGIEEDTGSFARIDGDPVLETYVNFALINGAVIVPQFGNGKLDQEALEIIAKAYPTRKVIPFNGREATLGGGGLHCLTKHIN